MKQKAKSYAETLNRQRIFCTTPVRLILILIPVFLLILLPGCGTAGEDAQPVQTPKDVVNFRALVMGTPPDTGLEEIYAQLDALTVPELSCTLRFEFIPWGNERKQINIAVASGEYDFISGGVFSDYRTLVSKNAFLDLNDYLYLVPDLCAHYATYSETALSDCEIDGGLYGLPQFGMGEIASVNEGFFYREDLRKQWNLEPIDSLENMEAYLYRAKEEERYQDQPLITDNRIWQSLWLMITRGKYLEVESMMETPLVVVRADDPFTVINRLQAPEFLQVLQYLRKWRRDGILDSNLLALSDNEGSRGKELMMADLKPCETNVPDWSASASLIPDLTKARPEWEYGFFPYTSGNREWYIGSLASSSVVSVSSKTSDPKKAVLLLEKIHTDQRYYDLVKYGAEGIHYRREGEYISFEDIPVSSQFGWTVCTDDLMNYETVPLNEQWHRDVEERLSVWKEELARAASPHPLDGFAFLADGTTAGQLDTAELKYFQPLVCGYYEDVQKGLEETLQALTQAGLNDYMADMQNQLDRWRAENRMKG